MKPVRLPRMSSAAGAAAIVFLVAVSPGRAEPPVNRAGGEQAPQDVCVDVKIGNDSSRYYDCLNAQMKRKAEKQADQQAVTQSAISNSQPQTPTQQGLYTQAATRERLGPAFGHSAQPPQQPAPQYKNPLVH